VHSTAGTRGVATGRLVLPRVACAARPAIGPSVPRVTGAVSEIAAVRRRGGVARTCFNGAQVAPRTSSTRLAHLVEDPAETNVAVTVGRPSGARSGCDGVRSTILNGSVTSAIAVRRTLSAGPTRNLAVVAGVARADGTRSGGRIGMFGALAQRATDADRIGGTERAIGAVGANKTRETLALVDGRSPTCTSRVRRASHLRARVSTHAPRASRANGTRTDTVTRVAVGAR
jgi:hypothetical protein